MDANVNEIHEAQNINKQKKHHAETSHNNHKTKWRCKDKLINAVLHHTGTFDNPLQKINDDEDAMISADFEITQEDMKDLEPEQYMDPGEI